MTSSPPGASETDLGRNRRARKIGRVLAETHPDAHCELDHSNALELAVATILSAQCTDKKVNEVTPKLFARYPSAADYAGADRAEMEELIRPTGFYRNKTDSLLKLGQALVERYDGEVPGRLVDLVTLPGIGRKTANVILGNAFDVPGITVDTHFQRLVHRWRLTTETDPVKIEHAVGALYRRSATGRCCRTGSSSTADGSATPASPPAAPARSRSSAPRTAPARPSRRPPRSCSRALGRATWRWRPGSTRSWCRRRRSPRRCREPAGSPSLVLPLLLVGRRLHRGTADDDPARPPAAAERPSPFRDCAATLGTARRRRPRRTAARPRHRHDGAPPVDRRCRS